MSYQGYVIAAYSVFALVLLADWLAGVIKVRRALRRNRALPTPPRTRRSTARTGMQELER